MGVPGQMRYSSPFQIHPQPSGERRGQDVLTSARRPPHSKDAGAPDGKVQRGDATWPESLLTPEGHTRGDAGPAGPEAEANEKRWQGVP